VTESSLDLILLYSSSNISEVHQAIVQELWIVQE
jgi:hypothetical protein